MAAFLVSVAMSDPDSRTVFSIRIPETPSVGHLAEYRTVYFERTLVTDHTGGGLILRFYLQMPGFEFVDLGVFQDVYQQHPEIHGRYLSNPLDLEGNQQGVLAFVTEVVPEDMPDEFHLRVVDVRSGGEIVVSNPGEHTFVESPPRMTWFGKAWAALRASNLIVQIVVGVIASVIAGVIVAVLILPLFNDGGAGTLESSDTEASTGSTNSLFVAVHEEVELFESGPLPVGCTIQVREVIPLYSGTPTPSIFASTPADSLPPGTYTPSRYAYGLFLGYAAGSFKIDSPEGWIRQSDARVGTRCFD